ncbi:MAG TPA: agmatine deiminase family protein [Burkholderiaceae bacterium]|nr:agmatine deiminase family protein [Burkholderiaceae bacterium]
MTDPIHRIPTARRRTLAKVGALAGLGTLPAACRPLQPPVSDSAGFRIPGDFEPAHALWLSFHPGHAELTASLVQTLHGQARLKFLLPDEGTAAEARRFFSQRGIRTDGIEWFQDPGAMFFLRDAAVFATGPQRRLGVVDFRWNQYGLPAWCALRHERNMELAARCLGDDSALRNDLDRSIARLTDARIVESGLFIEGGGIESNGNGLMIANEALMTQRNPGRSLAELERAYLELPGVRKVVWLREGLAEDPLQRGTIVGNHVGWGTGGHTDEFVRFADPRTVLLAWPDDADAAAHPVARLTRQRMQRNADILSRATDADGQPLRLLKVPTPRIIERRVFLSAAADRMRSEGWTADYFPPQERRREGDPVMQVACASYLNFVVANGVVVAPGYLAHGTPRSTQERVGRILADAFGGRQIRFVDSITANWVGGGLHCATLNEPQRT